LNPEIPSTRSATMLSDERAISALMLITRYVLPGRHATRCTRLDHDPHRAYRGAAVSGASRYAFSSRRVGSGRRRSWGTRAPRRTGTPEPPCTIDGSSPQARAAERREAVRHQQLTVSAPCDKAWRGRGGASLARAGGAVVQAQAPAQAQTQTPAAPLTGFLWRRIGRPGSA
jgi:hypothetical protein